jgi:hypothetical protein
MVYKLNDRIYVKTESGFRSGQIRTITRMAPILYGVLPDGEKSLIHNVLESQLERELDIAI